MVINCIFEDEKYGDLYPLTYFKPVFELICGIGRLRERISNHFKEGTFHYLCRNHLKSTLIERFNLNE